MTSLADAVLPLIRTRADLGRWSTANAHGRDMHEAVAVLEASVPGSDPAEVYAVTHKAIASAIKVIARADDSSGVIGDACRRLLDLHPRAAAAAQVPTGKLVDWMMAFQFDGDVDYFTLDPWNTSSCSEQFSLQAAAPRQSNSGSDHPQHRLQGDRDQRRCQSCHLVMRPRLVRGPQQRARPARRPAAR